MFRRRVSEGKHEAAVPDGGLNAGSADTGGRLADPAAAGWPTPAAPDQARPGLIRIPPAATPLSRGGRRRPGST